MNRWIWIIGASLAGVGVGLGAFGAHGLQDALPRWYNDADLVANRLENWETAVRYQMYHGIALLCLGLLPRTPGPWRRVAAVGLIAGSLIFSGCLYLLVLTNQTWLGAIVPLGGVLQLLGWGGLAIAGWKASQK